MTAKFYVGPKGGSVQFVNAQTGEVGRDVPLAPGVYGAAHFAAMRAYGETYIVQGGVMVAGRGFAAHIQHPGHYESAANPNFRVSPQQRQQREMLRMMTRTAALATRTQKQMDALQRAKASVPQIAPPASVDDAAALPSS